MEKKHNNSTPQSIMQCYQPPMPIERALFQYFFVTVELFVTHRKSTRLPIDLRHLAVLSCCYTSNYFICDNSLGDIFLPFLMGLLVCSVGVESRRLC